MGGPVIDCWFQHAVGGVACATACSVAVLLSCGAQTRVPITGPHTDADAPITVTSPPPEIRVESIPVNPDPRMVWVDGYWTWRGKGWSWHPGAWTLPAPRSYYAAPMLVRLPVAVYAPLDAGESAGDAQLVGYAMQLLFVPGHWHTQDGAIVEQSQLRDAAPAPTGSPD
jgi:hypothetical protein